MRKRRLILIQGDTDIAQTWFVCDRCGAEASAFPTTGADTVLFWKGKFVQVVNLDQPRRPSRG